ncbi:MAG TPA: hypothetical protein DCR46_02060 [Cytophagales bacterium]|nr:hypothetical protein [Cytophagales bacterium]
MFIINWFQHTRRRTVLFCLFVFVSFVACKQTKKVIFDPTDLSILVRNDLGTPQQGAQVRMYNDVNAYLNSKNNGAEEGFVEKAFTDAAGLVTFTDLNTDKEYYFLVTYRDRVRFADLDNFDEGFKFSKYLSKGVNTNAEIHLKPANSIVGFYVPSSLAGYLPVQFYVDNDSIGSIAETVSSVSGPSQTGLLSFRFAQGKKKWMAKSSQGCIWYGEVNVLPTESFSPTPLQENCNAGSVSFYVGQESLNQLPIEITFSPSDKIGTLYNTSSVPTTCFYPNTVTAARPIGKYTYTATYKRTNCVITDTITITKASCRIVKLPSCQ